MKIEVTQDDIDQGKANDCHLCPVARAIARRFGIKHGSNAAVSVRASRIIIFKFAHGNLVFNQEFDTPVAVQNFITEFDVSEGGEPFGFDLPMDQDAEGAGE